MEHTKPITYNLQPKIGAALVVGGGIGGMQAALDLAESGIKVYLVDKSPAIGGVMAQLDKTFPTNECAMCTMAPRLVEIGRHKDIEIITLSDVEKIQGEPGNFKVLINKKARYISLERCTACGECVKECPVQNRIYILPDSVQKVELEPQYREKVSEIISKYKDKSGALMLILQSVNTIYNYLPENVLRYISCELNYPLSLILRVASFYNAFSLTPIGKYVINICTGTTCYVRGAEEILRKFSEGLKIQPEETTKNMMFTLKTVRCVGCCSLAPVVNISGKTYARVKQREITAILKDYK